MPFFANTAPGTGFQPKRAFRFLVTFSKLGDLTFMVKNSAKPSYELTSTPHQILNHQFNFPGIVKWNPLDVTFIDAVDPNVGSKFYHALVNSGYVAPLGDGALMTGITKVGTTSTIGEVRIKQLDGGGLILPAGSDPGEAIGDIEPARILEEWTLKNAWIKSVKFGDGLGYDQEGLVNVTASLIYDYATYGARDGGRAYKA